MGSFNIIIAPTILPVVVHSIPNQAKELLCSGHLILMATFKTSLDFLFLKKYSNFKNKKNVNSSNIFSCSSLYNRISNIKIRINCSFVPEVEFLLLKPLIESRLSISYELPTSNSWRYSMNVWITI